jgi:hypothetical protein
MTGKNALAARKRGVQGGVAKAESKKKTGRTVSKCHPLLFACFFFYLSKPNAC